MDQPEPDYGAARKNIGRALDSLFSGRSLLGKQSPEWKSILETEAILFRIMKRLERKEGDGSKATSSWAAYQPLTEKTNADGPSSRR